MAAPAVELRFGESSAVRYDVGSEEQGQEVRPARRRMRAVMAGVGALMAVACVGALVGYGGSVGGAVALFAEAPGTVDRAEVQLQAEDAQLSKAVAEHDRIKDQQQKLGAVEMTLKREETAVRAQMHKARNAMVALKYKIHNYKTEQFSEGMFAGRAKKQAAHSNLARKKITEQAASDKKATTGKAFYNHLVQALSAAVAPSPAKATPAAQPKQEAVASSPLGISLMKHVGGGRAVPVEAKHAVVAQAAPVAPPQEKFAPAQEKLAGEQQLAAAASAPRPVVRVQAVQVMHARQAHAPVQVVHQDQAPMHAQAAPRVVKQEVVKQEAPRVVKQYAPSALDQRSAAASHLAQLAQRQAYERSDTYWRTVQERARKEAARAYSPLPAMPLLRALGPEAAAP